MSLKKIAEMTGVSPSTVSRVLNNKGPGCASQEVRDRIWAAARELHYVPDPHGKLLRTGKETARPQYEFTIIRGRFDNLETDPFFQELFRNMEKEIFAQNCTIRHVLPAHSFAGQIPETDGYIIQGRCPESLLDRLKKVSENIVYVGRNQRNFDIDEVICDGYKAAMIAMEHLLENGHKKIAYIGDCSYETRYIGYLEALLAKNLALDHSLIFHTNQTESAGYEAAKKLLTDCQATAVFCANDSTALGYLRALKEQSGDKKAPALVSIDNIEAAQFTNPPLTTVNIPNEEMAKAAVNILISRIQHRHREYVRIEFPCRLVVR